jgi:hypothetical protein
MKRPQVLKPVDATAAGYEGPVLWSVLWKSWMPATVAAPTPEAAMVAAARFWGVRWQAPDFYETVKVIKV